MRFEVSRVMDAIEQRLTTDPTLAQAVVDLGAVARFIDLDGGRAVNLLRIGMTVDALSRFLVDAGAMLYGIAPRDLLGDPTLSSKERMVLGRWTTDGLIEVVDQMADRAVEVADFTGLPLIAVQPADARRFPWLAETPERVLRLTPRHGFAVLTPAGAADVAPEVASAVVIGKATLPEPAPAGEEATDSAPSVEVLIEVPSPAAAGDLATVAVAAPEAGGHGQALAGETALTAPTAELRPVGPEAALVESTTELPEIAAPEEAPRPAGVDVFITRGAQRLSHTLIARRRFTRAAPSEQGARLLARQWRCDSPDCPMFGELRPGGQAVPALRKGKAACPRHGLPIQDVGPRPPAYAVSVVVDDLARRRFVVSAVRPVHIGRSPEDPDDISVGDWLHEAAAAWIDPVHLRLEVRDGTLVVTDTSENGTVVWRRVGPDERAENTRLHRSSVELGEWDSVELYTGYELVRGDRRLTTTVGSTDPSSVLVDAPTVAMPQLTRR